jgi:predicted AlkP superfamily phosphohydrolase/phosphomutase
MTEDKPRRRLLIIGLDAVPPEMLFDSLLPVMPNVRHLFERGARAPLRSTDPPITVPAWPVMFTGVDPGTLGFYGFRHRRAHSYFDTYVPASTLLPVPTLWQWLSQKGRRVSVIGMPPGYPPPAINGYYISDFLTPGGKTDFTHPLPLKAELEAKFGPYRFDVVFRAHERVQLFQDILAMTRQRFAIADHLYRRERWDVFAIHEIGTDRLHHAYWKYFDRTHPDFVEGNPFQHAAEQYYAELDRMIGTLLESADEHTAVLIASDHGSMRMSGCFCINQWLQERGYLTLRRPAPPGTPIEKADVDWSRTRVWGAGGYYARLFFNLQGREPQGIVRPEELPDLREHLIADLRGLKLPDGRPMKVDVMDPHRIYRSVRGDPPDLMLYFDDLRWRSAGTLGYPSLFLKENDTGPDDAVHGFDGVFLFYDPLNPRGRDLGPQKILDVTPTLLRWLGEPLPDHVQGRPIPGI